MRRRRTRKRRRIEGPFVVEVHFHLYMMQYIAHFRLYTHVFEHSHWFIVIVR